MTLLMTDQTSGVSGHVASCDGFNHGFFKQHAGPFRIGAERMHSFFLSRPAVLACVWLVLAIPGWIPLASAWWCIHAKCMNALIACHAQSRIEGLRVDDMWCVCVEFDSARSMRLHTGVCHWSTIFDRVILQIDDEKMSTITIVPIKGGYIEVSRWHLSFYLIES